MQKSATTTFGIPAWLQDPITISSEITSQESNDITNEKWKLSENTIKQLKENGITHFFPVQEAVLPVLMQTKNSHLNKSPGDLCVAASTGSGKTLAFVIPIVETLCSRIVVRLRALVVLPTRELAVQVKHEFDLYTRGTSLKVGLCTGQVSFVQEQAFINNLDILIATPGKLVDHLNQTPGFTLEHLRFLVIDEADRLLNQSFNNWLTQVQNSIEYTNENTVNISGNPIHHSWRKASSNTFATPIQKLVFSATLTRNPEKIALLKLTNPKLVAVSSEKLAAPSTLQEYYIVAQDCTKLQLVLHLFNNLGYSKALIFTKSVESAHRLQKFLEFCGLNSAVFSSEQNAKSRAQILRDFQESRIDLLVCSDVAARGLDLPSVEAVVNYDVASNAKAHLHRIGRTARAGRTGKAVTLLETHQAKWYKHEIVQSIDSKLEKLQVKPAELTRFNETYERALEQLKLLVKKQFKS